MPPGPNINITITANNQVAVAQVNGVSGAMVNMGQAAAGAAQQVAGSFTQVNNILVRTSESVNGLKEALAGLVSFEIIKEMTKSLIEAQIALQQINFSLQ